MKTDLSIAQFIHDQPNHVVSASDLCAFVGENAARRVSDLSHAHIVKAQSRWFEGGELVYTLDFAGDKLLADHEQSIQDERERRAQEYADSERKRLESESSEARNRRSGFLSAILGAIVGSVATFLIEHHSELFSLLRRILGLR